MGEWQSLSTQISQAYYFDPQVPNDPFQPARQISNKTKQPDLIYWLDQLLHGGLKIPPPQPRHPLLILLTGPAGSGKTTLAMELAYRWSRGTSENPKGFNSLYITSESEDLWLKHKAETYGWPKIERAFTPKTKDRLPDNSMVTIWQTRDFVNFLISTERRLSKLGTFVSMFRRLISGTFFDGPVHDGIGIIMDQISVEWQSAALRSEIARRRPDVLILDSINTLVPSERERIFEKFLRIISFGPQIMIIVLDSKNEKGSDDHWTYISDVVVRLDRKSTLDYLSRTIEVQKARYQSHVEGTHQLKIYSKHEEHQHNEDQFVKRIARQRAHPFRWQGGIFIYPSFHFHLSRIKRKRPTNPPAKIPAPIGLNSILDGGFPDGKCTAFIGDRGGHKSHLGYLCIMKRLIKDIESCALIISLRDDENVARHTINGILKDELHQLGLTIEQFEQQGRIEILYYPPGFITPEEFFHRMYMSICRFRSKGRKLFLLFNSVDQLAARFPLCAEERIFVPGIIELLSSEEITSFFIAVEEKGQPGEQYGLLAMADLHLRFSHEFIDFDKYIFAVSSAKKNYAHENFGFEEAESVIIDTIQPKYRVIVIEVIRFSGGQAAGPRGILEYVDATEQRVLKRYGRKGLRFAALGANVISENPYQT